MANISKIKLPNGNTYNVTDSGALPLTGGSVTGPTTFGDSVSIDDLTAGQLVVSGGASVANNLQVNTINGVTVGSSPKFTDTNTVTTATTTGSGNAVTAVTASNGALTITKGTTFLTAHNTYTVSTTGSGNAVTAVSLSGTTLTVTKGTTFPTINTTYGIATYNTNGLVKPWYSHTAASTGPTAGTNATAVAVNAITTTAGKYYAVEMDNAGRMFVNVPWTNTTYSSQAAASGGTAVSLVTTGEKYTWNNMVPTSRTINSKALSSNITLNAADVGAVPDCTIGLYNGNGGNPNPIRFLDVNYTNANSENGVLIKVTMRCGHGNGTSYNFLQDVFISVGYTGTVSVDIYRYYAQSITYESVTHYYGDIFYTIDTTNKIVTFYTLMGQYSTVYSSSFRRMNSSSGGTITQYTSATKYSSGTKTYGNVHMIGESGGTSVITRTATLVANGWSSGTQTVTVSGVTSSNNVIVSSAPSSYQAYISAGVYCSAQGANSLTFTCITTPSSALIVNVLILG